MIKKELINFMSRIKAHYQNFVIDDFKIDEWYEQLKDYDVADLNTKLDSYIRSEYSDIPPKVNYLLSGLIKSSNKGIIPNYIIECPMCHYDVSLKRFDEHYKRCSAINYLCNQSKKIYGASLNKSALYLMDKNKFEKLYSNFLNKTIDRHKLQETKVIMRILYPNNSEEVIDDMVNSLFKNNNRTGEFK